MIEVLDQQYPGLAARLLDSSGLRRYLNVYVGAHDVRFGDGLATTIPHGERVTILPASSGGMFLP
jgi:molybdopterin synthase sulfur carrier subunit